MPKIEGDLLTKLKAEHGPRLHILDARPLIEDEIAVLPASPAVYRIWKQKQQEKDPTANTTLVAACCKHPPADELRKLMEDYPALADTWGFECQQISGFVKGDHRRKA